MGQITYVNLNMVSNADGAEANSHRSTLYQVSYQLQTAGYVASRDFLNFSVTSDYNALTPSGKVHHLLYSSKPSTIGFYDANIFLLSGSNMPISIRLGRKAIGQQGGIQSNMRIDGAIPANILLPRISVQGSRLSRTQQSEKIGESNSLHMGVSNRSADNKAGYSMSYRHQQSTGVLGKALIKTFDFSTDISPNKKTQSNTSIQLRENANNVSINGVSTTQFIFSPRARLRSNLVFISNGREESLNRSINLKNEYSLRFGQVGNLRLHANAKSVALPNSELTSNRKEGALGASVINTFSFLSKNRITLGLNHDQRFDLQGSFEPRIFNSSLNLSIRRSLFNKIHLNMSENVSHNKHSNSIERITNSSRIQLRTRLWSKTDLRVSVTSNIAYDVLNNYVNRNNYTVETKLAHNFGRIPVHVDYRLSDRIRSTSLKIQKIRLGRNGSFTLNYTNRVQQTTVNAIMSSLTNNSLSLSGNYRFFAYHITGRLHYNLRGGQMSNRYNISITRSISFAF